MSDGKDKRPIVGIVPKEDRAQDGTRLDRSRDPLPLGVRVRYTIAVVVAAIAAYVGGTALTHYQDSSRVAHQAKTAAQQAKTAARQAQAVASQNASLARQNGALVRQVSALAARLATDEHSTCVIQARGLPASHELAASMADIHALLTLSPRSKAQRLAARQTPPYVRKLVADLNTHLGGYQRREAKQPQSRRC